MGYKKAIRGLANSQLGVSLRNWMNFKPTSYVPDLSESVSDLFVWRNDSIWETWFDLFHLAGLINPRFKTPYQVRVDFYDLNGCLVHQIRREIQFGELSRVDVALELSDNKGIGTFSVLHMVDWQALFDAPTTCLSERGYASYRRKSDPEGVRSYAHGNQYLVGCRPADGRQRIIGVAKNCLIQYQPQVTLDDCQSAELLVVNPTATPLDIELQVLGRTGAVLEKRRHRLPEKGCFSYDMDTVASSGYRFRLISRAQMLRPLIIKHYNSHFDVFHG